MDINMEREMVCPILSKDELVLCLYGDCGFWCGINNKCAVSNISRQLSDISEKIDRIGRCL